MIEQNLNDIFNTLNYLKNSFIITVDYLYNQIIDFVITDEMLLNKKMI